MLNTNEYRGKIIYIVDYHTFDAVINLGFHLTFRIRCNIKGMPNVSYPLYGRIKKLVSEELLGGADPTTGKFPGKEVILRTYKGAYHCIWDTEIIINNKQVNSSIISKVKKIVEENSIEDKNNEGEKVLESLEQKGSNDRSE